eukprot:CAMPEP_0115871152 /NCGR_PEP_ID=MMETSP0287-20121206/22712_1 /TAXON_ID=412157 /ORGANISM="Chrysochromulina rotalis, Strain UIO044" /LENGTH=63 /DNA_ID=CAMNT_0003325931 /DNA_START=35 /DNA_END=226 /DNA_ORIENTATION=-
MACGQRTNHARCLDSEAQQFDDDARASRCAPALARVHVVRGNWGHDEDWLGNSSLVDPSAEDG